MGSCLSKLQRIKHWVRPNVDNEQPPQPGNNKNGGTTTAHSPAQRRARITGSGEELGQVDNGGPAGADALDGSGVPIDDKNETTAEDHGVGNSGQHDHSSHYTVAVAQAALTQLIVAPWTTAPDIQPDLTPELGPIKRTNTSDRHELLQSIEKLCGLAVTYLGLQHELVENLKARTSHPSQQRMTAENLNALLGKENYEEYNNKVNLIEAHFRMVNEKFVVGTLPGTQSARLSPGQQSFLEKFRFGVRAMRDMGSGDKPKKDDITRTQDVLRTLSRKFQESKSEEVRYLKENVHWNGAKDKSIKLNLDVLQAFIHDLRKIIRQSGVITLPGLGRDGTYGYHWHMDLAKEEPHAEMDEVDSFAHITKDRRTESIPLGHENLEDLDNDIQHFEEIRAIGFGKQMIVNQENFAPKSRGRRAGKYRGVCKLMIRSRNLNDPHTTHLFAGSGWVYKKNTVVTAGHCVFNRNHEKYGRIAACDINVYLGYSGQPRHDGDGVECLRASRVFVHRLWFEQKSWPCDVAVIRLESDFKSPGDFNLGIAHGEIKTEKISIVGYPGDVPSYQRATSHSNRKGNVMYKSTGEFNFNTFNDHITYKADTSGGK